MIKKLQYLSLPLNCKRAVFLKLLTICMLVETAPLRSSTIREEVLPYFKKTIFTYPWPKLSSAQERPLYWAGCGLMAPCKLAPTNWPPYPPSTVQGLCSCVAAHKVLSCVFQRFLELLDPLDQATAVKESKEKNVWCDELLLTFKISRHALADNWTITILQAQDA